MAASIYLSHVAALHPLRQSVALPLLPAPKPKHRRLHRRPVVAISSPTSTTSPFVPNTVPSQSDPISVFHERVRRFLPRRHRSSIKPEEADVYTKFVLDQQRRGLRKLEGDGTSSLDVFSGRVDPYKLVPGDFIVHKKVGVGKFVTIASIRSKSGTELEEYVFLEYADGMAKVSVKKAPEVLYLYGFSGDKKKPRTLSKLKDTRPWEKKIKKGKIAVQKMVVDLMELYMDRLKQRRPPYPKAPLWDEFRSQFLFEPTPDQQQAFIDVEKDLTERETPMDRLICGDVGFGKTEVALRAIFCVVSAGKQAMVLAPTIVLARQHFEVISERFSPFPDVKVGMLSRFQTKSEKDKYISMIKQGDLNIIVGTHSLLGSQVLYTNVGLLVIDEEQRFGVKQKEQIQMMKTSVDVLSLSATPIPRTLYLALTGFRDASLITTPPPERVPIKTYLLVYSELTVESAIRNELERGGQVFFVLPRIKGLEETQEFLQTLFPDTAIAVAHGQQMPKQLEETMRKFALGEIKILICTTIVESGLDIQNANTIIIKDAQHFGLAQLYQLRGRVGRSDKEAFAYLFYADKSQLSKESKERLDALQDHHELGQGFNLAERDMGIRGFGSMFGEQQTGYIGDVGAGFYFDMLCESLSKVDVNRLTPVPYKKVKIEIEVTTRHSSEYINYVKNPVELIKEAEKAAEQDVWSLIEYTENLRRMYGKEPHSMELFLKKLYVRRMAADLAIYNIFAVGKVVYMRAHINAKAFQLMNEALTPNKLNVLTFDGNVIKGQLLIELPQEQLLNWVFERLSELYSSLSLLVKC